MTCISFVCDAASERGFSVNKEILVSNSKEKSLIALPIVCDYEKNSDVDSSKLEAEKQTPPKN